MVYTTKTGRKYKRKPGPKTKKKRGRPAKKKPVGRPRKKGVKRVGKTRRISRAVKGAKRGRPRAKRPVGRPRKKTGKKRGRPVGSFSKKAPRTKTIAGLRFTRKSGHKTRAIAVRNAPKMHRILKFEGRYWVYTRGR